MKTSTVPQSRFVGWLRRLSQIEVGRSKGPENARIPRKELTTLLRLLLMLLENGLSLPKALTTLANDRASRRWRPVLTRIRQEVESGSSLSDVLKRMPQTFDEMLVQQIRIGERTGNLNRTLSRICESMERTVAVRKRIVKKLSYPVVVTLAGTALTIFMVAFVVPEFESVYKSSHVSLPLVTRVVTGLSRAVFAVGPFLFLSLVLTWFGLNRARKNSQLAERIDGAVLRIPLLGKWLRDAAVLQFADALLAMVDSGYTPADAVAASVPCVGNHAVRRCVDNVRKGMQRGERLSAILARHDDLFPATFCQLVGIGEQSGDFGKAINGACKHLREVVEARIDASLGVLEPIITIGLASIVGSIVLSIYMPMFNMFEVLE